MFKEYWNLNKKYYYILLGLLIFQIIVSFLLMQYFEQMLAPLMTGEIDAISTEPIGWVRNIIGIGFVLGIMGFGIMLLKWYLMIRPFWRKQLKQTQLIGNDPIKFVRVHIGLSLVMSVLYKISDLLLSRLNSYYTFGAVTSDAVNATNYMLTQITGFIGSFAAPLWILAILLLSCNRKVYRSLATKPRIFAIIGTVIGAWFVIEIGSFLPTLQQIFDAAIGFQTPTIITTLVMHTQFLSIVIDVVVIIAFIFIYRSFAKNYEV